MTVLEKACAKINLSLDVKGKRPDGYHEMDMIMQSVSLWDEVSVTLTDTPGIEVDINVDSLPKGLQNLAGKAAQEFFRYVNITNKGVKVYIKKNIPDKAGMAGGSSDAAAVIRGLNSLTGSGLSDRELYEICARVGSDVAFCLRGGTARATGRGEILQDLPGMPDCDIVLARPDFSVATPELFARIDSCEIGTRPDAGRMEQALERGDLRGVCREVGNVFEQVLPERAAVESIKAELTRRGALAACMTGTGSVVYGLFEAGKAPADREIPGCKEIFFAKPLGKHV